MNRQAFTSVVVINYLHNSIQVGTDAALLPLIVGRELDMYLSH